MSSKKPTKNADKPESTDTDAAGGTTGGGSESSTGDDAGKSQGSDRPSAGANDDPAPTDPPPVANLDDAKMHYGATGQSVSGNTSYEQAEDTGGFPMPIPTVGRIVLYCLTEDDAAAVNRRREHRGGPVLGIAHTGNVAHEGDVLPMLIVAVWGAHPGAAVNGQVFLDGNDTLWVRSVVVGNEPGRFNWPNRIQ